MLYNKKDFKSLSQRIIDAIIETDTIDRINNQTIKMIIAERGIYVKNALNKKKVLITLGMNDKKILEEYQSVL